MSYSPLFKEVSMVEGLRLFSFLTSELTELQMKIPMPKCTLSKNTNSKETQNMLAIVCMR